MRPVRQLCRTTRSTSPAAARDPTRQTSVAIFALASDGWDSHDDTCNGSGRSDREGDGNLDVGLLSPTHVGTERDESPRTKQDRQRRIRRVWRRSKEGEPQHLRPEISTCGHERFRSNYASEILHHQSAKRAWHAVCEAKAIAKSKDGGRGVSARDRNNGRARPCEESFAFSSSCRCCRRRENGEPTTEHSPQRWREKNGRRREGSGLLRLRLGALNLLSGLKFPAKTLLLKNQEWSLVQTESLVCIT